MGVHDLKITAIDGGKDFVVISWMGNIGWGTYTLQIHDDGKVTADSECMDKNENKAFLKEILEAIIAQTEIVG